MPIHEDFAKLRIRLSLEPGAVALVNAAGSLGYRMERLPHDVRSEKHRIRGHGDRAVPIEVFRPRGEDRGLPCLFFVHGGAFVFKAAPHHKKLICRYASALRCVVVSVDYGLAPEHPHPCALEDCYAAMRWTMENAAGLGIDAENIGICGDSAGGFLAAVLTRLLRDRLRRTLRFQMLVYPVIDPAMATDWMKRFTDTPLWNAVLNRRMWELYLPGGPGGTSGFLPPLRFPDFSSLPEAYVEVSEFDCLRDEGIAYHQTLAAHGVQSTLHETRGTIHGFEANYGSAVTQGIIEERVRFARERFLRKEVP